ncbi:MAG: nucleotide sugar dehydrogenase, partial [Oscillospiraceae bacterium]|nr:nucleotide sugar dehydrogenase [Oscillospiraceae bacterium]
MKLVNVVGLGYIGLPTALMMAAHGVNVVGTDYQKKLVNTLNAGKITFKEDGLEELFEHAIEKGITFSSEYCKADIYIVCVATPYDKVTKKIDATYVVNAVKNIL